MNHTEYQENVAARFGKDGKLPSWADLAKREVAAMRRITGHQEARPSSTIGSPASSERVQAQRAAWESKRAARDMAILDYLSGDFRTSGDVATRFKVSVETAQQALRKLKDEGLIVTAKSARVTIYRKAEADDAPEHQQAKPITVHGHTFPSMSGCARHFGISVQAVAYHVRRGSLDTLAMRKEAAE